VSSKRDTIVKHNRRPVYDAYNSITLQNLL